MIPFPLLRVVCVSMVHFFLSAQARLGALLLHHGFAIFSILFLCWRSLMAGLVVPYELLDLSVSSP